ncbi:MAG: M56 family metallopeptidase [Planctomycetaceae bacterium]
MTSESISHWLGYVGIQNFFTTALMAVIVWLLCHAYAKNPATQNLLWLLVLLKFVTPPIAGMTWQLPTVTSSVSQPAPLFTMSSGEDGAGEIAIKPAHLEATILEEARSVPAGFSSFVSTTMFWRLIAGVWLIGAATVLASRVFRAILRHRIVHRGAVADEPISGTAARVARQLGLRAPAMRVVSGIDSPFLCCLGRVTLAWPLRMVALPESNVRAVLAHEIAHLRRGDHWVARLELLASTLWWWNPVYWYVRRQLHCTAEMSCDAIALTTYPHDRSLYAEMLLCLSTGSETSAPPLFLAVGGSASSSLERRMTMIVSDRVSGDLNWSSLLVAGLLVAIGLPAWSLAQDSAIDKSIRGVASSQDDRGIAGQMTPLKPTIARLLEGRRLFVDSEGSVHVQIAPAPLVRLTDEFLPITFAFPTSKEEALEISQFPHIGAIVQSEKMMSQLAGLLEKSGFDRTSSAFDVPTKDESPSVTGFIMNSDYKRKEYGEEVSSRDDGGYTVRFVALVRIPGERSECIRVRAYGYNFEKKPQRMACYSDYDLLIGPAMSWQTGDETLSAAPSAPIDRSELHKRMFEICGKRLHNTR